MRIRDGFNPKEIDMTDENELYSRIDSQKMANALSLNSLETLMPEEVNYDSSQFQQLTEGFLLGEHKNYRLIKKLGEGGMGQTWLAMKIAGGKDVQQVVCKILSDKLRQNPGAMAEIHRTFLLTQGLNHRGICPMLGIETDPRFGDFLTMKYAEGGTLWESVRSCPGWENGLSLESLLPIFRPLAEALDYAHRAGVIHRDIKPQNIMFMRSGQSFLPVLIDFGIAARIHPNAVPSGGMTFSREDLMSHSSSGTPLYMAPEQMEGSPQDGRTDQYSFAAVLYEILTGNLPFSGKNVVKIGFEKLRFRPVLPHFSKQINDAFTRALSVNPADRYPTCSEFIHALENGLTESRKSSEEVFKSTQPEVERNISKDFENDTENFFHQRLHALDFGKTSSLDSPKRNKYLFFNSILTNRERQKLQSSFVKFFSKENQPWRWSIYGLVLLGIWFLVRILFCPEYANAGRVFVKAPWCCGEHFVVPDQVKLIGKYAFQDCSSLLSIHLPDTVKEISEYSFFGCANLNSIRFSKNLRFIGNHAFCECRSLSSIRLPASVEWLGNSAFDHCVNLYSVELSANMKTIPSYAFSRCFNLSSIRIPEGVTSIEKKAFASCRSLKTVELPSSLKKIEEAAFYECSDLEFAVIPEGVEKMPNAVFQKCDALRGVHLPASLKEIGDYAFSECFSLEYVVIPPQVKKISHNAFGENAKKRCLNFTLYGNRNSAAQEIAEECGIDFKDISEFNQKAENLEYSENQEISI